MGDNIMIYGDNWLNELSSKLGKNFGRYKRGEITLEECDRLDNEILEAENKRIEKDFADIKAAVERNNQ
jgi:hypothetical protein